MGSDAHVREGCVLPGGGVVLRRGDAGLGFGEMEEGLRLGFGIGEGCLGSVDLGDDGGEVLLLKSSGGGVETLAGGCGRLRWRGGVDGGGRAGRRRLWSRSAWSLRRSRRGRSGKRSAALL